MQRKKPCLAIRTLSGGMLLATAGAALAAEEVQQNAGSIEEVVVFGQARVFANNRVTDSMISQQAPITSVTAVIDNLPGVSVQEGDTFGFDDWSTTISIRGFQTSLADQQIGMTIDGLPNGNSNYGGGAKANRYIDSANLGGVNVSQGTADIASRSNEALGGTLDFLTSDPLQESGVTLQGTTGEFDAQRFYGRYDTGLMFDGTTRAWFSASHQEATDWINGAAENVRDHVAAKFVSDFRRWSLTGYLSYDDTQEDNYQRLFSPAEFAENDAWDRLTADWTGVPYVDQLYRRGWSTLRENTFGYLKAEFEAAEGLDLSAAVYAHHNEGRGDWVPPYLLDVVDDAGGPESEVLGAPAVLGGGFAGLIYFVDGAGNALSPTPGCVSSITFPYGGAGPEYDPACYADGAIAVQSFRNTHYEKDRLGLTADFDWTTEIQSLENRLRGGIWYEDTERNEWRDWHRITDTRVGFEWESQPYWVQYDRTYPQDTFKWYLEDTLSLGAVDLTLGAKQFLVNVDREDNFNETPNAGVNSDSDVLWSGGILYRTPVEGLEVFAGYAENFKALSDLILERPSSDLSNIAPETAENIDVGLRYSGEWITLAATYYDIEFSNRIIFLDNSVSTGPNYIIGTNGTYFNAGGINSDGFEISGLVQPTDSLSVYLAYSRNNSEYVGTGDAAVDAAVGIVPGNDVVNMPDSQYVLTLDYARGPLNVGISTKYTDSRAVNFSNSWVADDYLLTDVYVTVNGEGFGGMLENATLDLVVNNLADKTYLAGISGNGAWLGAPRTATLTGTIRF
ncbi:MAG: TonB-dependent receptor [Pseudomonadales bacterium]|jgi:outer membrane receptor for Fe3+-dicitrate|nr:TonB-dependent receptor [Pseudomonadales bacterium]